MSLITGVSLEKVQEEIATDVVNLTVDPDGTVYRVRRNGSTAVVGVFKGASGDKGLIGDPGDPGTKGTKGISGVSSPQVSPATNAQVLAGTANGVAITAKNLASYLVVRHGKVSWRFGSPASDRRITFPSGSFSGAPKVLVTAQSTNPGEHVSAVTANNVTALSFDIELSFNQNLGASTQWTVNWIAFGVYNG